MWTIDMVIIKLKSHDNGRSKNGPVMDKISSDFHPGKGMQESEGAHAFF